MERDVDQIVAALKRGQTVTIEVGGAPLKSHAAQPLKQPDADIIHLLETLEMDEELNSEFDCCDGEFSREASRLITTARRLVREAGYALPETTGE